MKKKINTVLLVDDDDGTNFLNRMVIESADIAGQVQIALNGKEALDYLTNKGKYDRGGDSFPLPELIFLDINMPVMDGWEFLEAYNQLPENKKNKIVVVMLTSSFNPDEKRRAEKNRNSSEFKNKPLTEEMLSEIFGKYFSE